MSGRPAGRLAALVAALAATTTAAPLAAQSVELGSFGTFTRFDRSLFVDDHVGAGGRLAVGLPALGGSFRLEAEATRTATIRNGAAVTYLPARARLGYERPFGRVSMLLGAGGVRTAYDGSGGEVVDWGLTGAVGLRIRLTTLLSLRIDGVTDYVAQPENEASNMPDNWNSSALVGLALPLYRWGGAPTPYPGGRGEWAAEDARRSEAPRAESGAVADVGASPAPASPMLASRDYLPESVVTAAPAPAAAPEPSPAAPRAVRTVLLRTILFTPWSDDLSPAAMAALDEVARQLLAAPPVTIEVAGFTSLAGDRQRNLRLALSRARTVRAYLVSRGVSADRLVARAHGEGEQIATNGTEAGRAMNRRVELRPLR